MAATTPLIENYIPFIKFHGYQSDKAVDLGSTLNVDGAVTLGSTLGVTGVLSITGGEVANTEVVAATNVITAAESGKTFFLSASTEFASTLPAPAAGLHYRFIVTAAPSGASYTVATNAAAQVLAGQVHASDGADADSEAAATATTITFVDGASVIGDWADVISDGTSWFAQCYCDVSTGITITG